MLNKLALGSTEFAVGTSIAERVRGWFEQEIAIAGVEAAGCTARRQISKKMKVSLNREVVGT